VVPVGGRKSDAIASLGCISCNHNP
jgi:hypothetical protein